MDKTDKQPVVHRIIFTISMVFLWLSIRTTAHPQDSLYVYVFPSDSNVSVTAHCNVISSSGKYTYRYSPTSASSSEQDVESFYVDHNSTIDSVGSPNLWLGGPEEGNVVMWDARRAEVRIRPGAQLQGFSITSPGIPSIFRFYARGYSVAPTPEGEPDSVVGNNVFENSFKGKTIAPADPPSPFNGLTFLDTIKSYISESRTLGWITNDPTANKYMRLIDTARAHLQANNRGVTKAKLDSVLVNVYPDTAAGVISSEAYALLRFNTEYLLRKLREEDSAYAAENTSSWSDATATNNARHLAKSEGYLHEVFVSGGEIFYRRSADAGSTWDQTHRLNTEVGENSHPCITIGESGTLQVVWQRKIAPATYEVWHAYSQDRGESWSMPVILPGAGQVAVSQYQPGGAMPVIAERKKEQPVVVYCSQTGLRYRISGDDGATWQIPRPDSITGKNDDRVQSPSLVGDGSLLSLIYESGDEDSPWSQTYDGSRWSDERSVGKETSTPYGRSSSIAIDLDNKRLAAWSADHTWSRSIMFRLGSPDNTWSNWFVEFWGGQLSPDWVNPSLTYYHRNGHYGIGIVHHTAADAVQLIAYDDGGGIEPPSWNVSTLSETGRWGNITQENATSGTPIYCWTDQSAFPHEIMIGSSGLSAVKGGGMTTAGMTHRRRAVVHHRILRSTLSLEVEPMKLVLATGDTAVVQFKRSSLRQPQISFAGMWDYLGTDTLRVPANARRLVITKQFTERGSKMAQRKFYLRLLDRDGTVLAVLDSTSASGTVSVNIAAHAGREVIVRPQVVLVGVVPSAVEVAVGDVFVVPERRAHR